MVDEALRLATTLVAVLGGCDVQNGTSNLKIRNGNHSNEDGIVEISHPRCSGTQIANNFFMTAAHCLAAANEDVKSLRFEVGGRAAKGTWHETLRPFPLHSYTIADSAHDLSIVQFDRPSSQHAEESPWPLFVGKFQSNEIVKIIATGRRSESQPTPGITEGEMKFVGYQQTEKGRIAVFKSTAKDQGVCGGDSGGGVFVMRDGEHYLAGVISMARISEEKNATLSDDVANNLSELSEAEYCELADQVNVVPLSEHKDWLDTILDLDSF